MLKLMEAFTKITGLCDGIHTETQFSLSLVYNLSFSPYIHCVHLSCHRNVTVIYWKAATMKLNPGIPVWGASGVQACINDASLHAHRHRDALTNNTPMYRNDKTHQKQILLFSNSALANKTLPV